MRAALVSGFASEAIGDLLWDRRAQYRPRAI